ncbi:MAG TPA: M20/M25/M40 family metallo-hydrolase [Thermoanaerobaculia bacterium]|nr:M20/M25/M40 family metallo-hydrolase [Thermoanaerobaculia bacterium]
MAWALVLLALTLLLVVVRRQPPAPRAASAPAAEFSAGRARQVLQTLVGDGRPHPVGSPANDQVRSRVMAVLSGLGYKPEVQEGFACHYRSAVCGRVRNVLARLPGREPGRAVLLASHYDSVPAGPGAADDLTGVAAVLEIARILKAGPAPRNTVLLLIDDGEEAGLLGASAFLADNPAAREVKAVVNLEARGSSGPSLMFETVSPDAWMIPLWSRGASHPVTSSIYVGVYRRMPNDTDLTEFRHRRIPGLNFAFVGEPTHYHTPLDSFANASPASLQHHGDNGLAAVRGLAGADLSSPPPGDAVFFDLLGLGVIRWPVGWTLGLALLGLVLVLLAAARAVRGGAASGKGVALGALALPATLVATVALGWVLNFALALAGVFPTTWVAHPLPAVASFWLLALAVTVLVTARLGAPAGLWVGVWLDWAILGVVVAALAPGFSYIFVVPSLVAGLTGLLAGVGGPGPRLVPALAAALLWLPLIVPLFDGLGPIALIPIAAVVAALLSSFAPAFAAARPAARRALWQGALALVVVSAVIAVLTPRHSPRAPRIVNLMFHQDATTGEARWLVRGSPASPAALPPGLRAAATFHGQPEAPFPWSSPQSRAFVSPAPVLAAPGPEIAVLASSVAGGTRTLRLRLTSPRGAPEVTFYVPAAARLEALKIEGHDALGSADAAGPYGGWYSATDVTLSAGGCEVEAVLGEASPQDWYVVDSSRGLPPNGRRLLLARPPTATPGFNGDTTLVSRKVRI